MTLEHQSLSYHDREAGLEDGGRSDDDTETLLSDHEKKDWKMRFETLNGKETPTCWKRVCGFFTRWRWLLDTTLLLIIIGLLLDRRGAVDSHNTQRPEPGGDLTGFSPSFSHQIVTFTPSEKYAPSNITAFFDDPATKQAWVDLVPKGLGYVDIDKTDSSPAKTRKQTYDNLPNPLPEYKNQTVFTTSVTHQLHCLYAILEGYAGMKTGRGEPEGDHHHRRTTQGQNQESDGEFETEEGVESFHLQHCFEYLRQSIICAGDVALEGTQTTFPDGFEGSDGWDAKHVCRDYGQVYAYLEENRATNWSWIA